MDALDQVRLMGVQLCLGVFHSFLIREKFYNTPYSGCSGSSMFNGSTDVFGNVS